AARTNQEHAELGARILHRCVLAVPAASRLREQALGDLAGLADAGLDPVLLGAGKLADRYLTRAPTQPATDKLTVTVAPSPMPAGKSYPQIPDKLNEADVRGALVACWEAYNAQTHKDALTVAIGIKSIFAPSEYEDEPGTITIKLDPPVAMAPGSPESAADGCVRQIVEPAIKGLKLTDAFTTKLAITIK
ncbi:MAG TPA: hypothetical protein VF469_13345, partial [Kofleriaceae bacterium]